MKRTITTAALALSALAAAAQDYYGESSAVRIDEAGRIHRTEVIPYDTRRDAEARNREAGGYYLAFSPRQMAAAGDMAVSGATLDIPYAWTDGVIYLHLENVGSAYSLWINDRPVAEVEDPATPAEFAVSPYIRQEANDIRLVLRPSATPQINPATPRREAFANSYLYYQNKRSIRDFEIALVPDSTRRFGVLELAIVAQNAFNYDEKVTVGYDIYSPQGKLLDFNMREVSIPGRSVDTVRFSPFIYGSYDNEWKAGGKTPPLYKVMLFTRRDGVYKEYMPLRIGFGRTELEEGRPMRLGRELQARPRLLQRRGRSRDDPRRAESAQGAGQEHRLPRLPAAGVVLRALRPDGTLRDRPGRHRRPRAARRPPRGRYALERPRTGRRVPRAGPGHVLPFAQLHLRGGLRPGQPLGQRIQYV